MTVPSSPESRRGGEANDNAANRRRRSLRVRLNADHQALLRELASDVGVTPDQLASIWLRDRLDVAASARSAAAARHEPAHGWRQAGAGSQAHHAPTGPRRSLHTAIVEVLDDHGGPMTAAQIAEAIRSRGAYHSPRSGQPITGATISRRVANPYYRDLFERDGRRLGLARRADSEPG